MASSVAMGEVYVYAGSISFLHKTSGRSRSAVSGPMVSVSRRVKTRLERNPFGGACSAEDCWPSMTSTSHPLHAAITSSDQYLHSPDSRQRIRRDAQRRSNRFELQRKTVGLLLALMTDASADMISVQNAQQLPDNASHAYRINS